MSIDLNWDTLTSGPEGEALAASIRDFVHTKFQAVPLPRFIKSVAVHEFEFGKVAPQVVLKDICDPLPDFYEEDPDVDYGDDEDDDNAVASAGQHDSDDAQADGGYNDYDDEDGEDNHMSASIETLGASSTRTGEMSMPPATPVRRPPHRERHGTEEVPDTIKAAERRRHAELDRRRYGAGRGGGQHGDSDNPYRRAPELRRFNSEKSEFPFPSHLHLAGAGLRSGTPDLGTPFLGLGASTPGIAGGMSNMHYFQSKLGPGWSGTQTPLAAVAGAQHLGGWLDAANNKDHQNGPAQADARRRAALEGISPGAAAAAGPSSRTGSAVADGYYDGHHVHEHHRVPSQSSVSSNDFPTLLAPPLLREKHSVSTLAATSTGNHSRPPTRDKPLGPSMLSSSSALASDPSDYANSAGRDNEEPEEEPTPGPPQHDDEERRFREPRVDDMQAVFRIKYSGDVRLRLTAEILLDYPMPSFVGIPLKLNITGLTFDGVGVLANIRKRVHFCFLSPEDALAAVGDDDGDADKGDDGNDNNDDHDNEHPHNHEGGGGASGDHDRGHGRQLSLATAVGVGLHPSGVGLHPASGSDQHHRLMESLTLDPTMTSPGRGGYGATSLHNNNNNTSSQQQQQQQQRGKVGGLLQEIRVESEIGQREGTKQSLKNVGKVERFVLEQVRRIFEEELVYPSFWTFLV
ncbi:uncharacterized protein B0I36DRAFT_327314 [Microdochium trichocladiopsis]|uniref:Mitochondrial distribution and morphology protein 12 n=1 Tax=Microdochium trichocladiopsis TaxID=1682393 RepID=A0A9P8Y4N1_9PEZI|nr:uncharacterized protein B0I36DRAFT_327314 [Microdochium trichocladiopsis]KAH7027545.1 hypothetical protein B0I36DRAFT_327314 [Microdochium trichocladiopsis]